MAADGLASRRAGARLAYPHHQHLGVCGLESMEAFEVRLQRAHELFLNVENASAHLADGMVVVAAG